MLKLNLLKFTQARYKLKRNTSKLTISGAAGGAFGLLVAEPIVSAQHARPSENETDLRNKDHKP